MFSKLPSLSVARSRQGMLLLLCAMAALLTGCSAPQSTFYWGEYESMVYQMYLEPGSADSTTQITLLQEDIQKSKAKGLRIAPGIHAHLGYMYALEGNVAQAKTELVIEKSLYPESAIMIDGMLERLEGSSR